MRKRSDAEEAARKKRRARRKRRERRETGEAAETAGWNVGRSATRERGDCALWRRDVVVAAVAAASLSARPDNNNNVGPPPSLHAAARLHPAARPFPTQPPNHGRRASEWNQNLASIFEDGTRRRWRRSIHDHNLTIPQSHNLTITTPRQSSTQHQTTLWNAQHRWRWVADARKTSASDAVAAPRALRTTRVASCSRPCPDENAVTTVPSSLRSSRHPRSSFAMPSSPTQHHDARRVASCAGGACRSRRARRVVFGFDSQPAHATHTHTHTFGVCVRPRRPPLTGGLAPSTTGRAWGGGTAHHTFRSFTGGSTVSRARSCFLARSTRDDAAHQDLVSSHHDP